MIAGEGASGGVIAGLWHWTESNLVTAMVREAKRPVLLYADDDPAWAGTTCVTSVGASLWESAVNEYALNHVRIKGGDVGKVKAWARAAEAVSKLSRKSLLLWGGAPYTLGMEHLMDDLPGLKRIVGDFVILDQYVLVRKAEELLSGEEERVEGFYDWLNGKVKVKFDGRMLTPGVLKKQIALYLAAKESWGGNTVKSRPSP